MTWDITFSEGLLLFATVLTPVYLAMLILSEKTGGRSRERVSSARLGTVAIASLFSLEALVIFLLNFRGFKENLTYSVFLMVIAGLLLCTLRSSPSFRRLQPLLLAAAVLCHLTLVYQLPSGLSIHERAAAMAKLTLSGYWDPSCFSSHSVYSPVPLDLELLSTLSIVTSISTIDSLKDLIMLLISIVAYDVFVYTLTKRVTQSEVAGIFALIVLASTPPANFVFHESKWVASLLVLVSALALVKAFDGVSRLGNIAIANVSYVAAVFFHPSAAIGGFLPLTIVATSYVARGVLKNKGWAKLSESGVFRATAALFLTVTLARAIYTAGYLEAILPSLNSFVSAALGQSPASETYTTVYERSVSPINAFAWAAPVSMAFALVLYSLFRRKAVAGNFTLAMSFLGMVFIFLGYLAAALRAGGFQGAMYPAFVFLVPSGAALGQRVLGSSKILAAILLVTLVLSTGIASTDPRFSAERYRMTGAGDVDTKPEDYATALFLTDRISADKSLFVPYEIISSFEYLTVVAGAPSHRVYTSSADLQRVEIDRVVIDRNLLDGVMYIWPERWLPNVSPHLGNTSVNVYFDSSRHVVFEK